MNGRRAGKRLFEGASLEENTFHEDADDHGAPYGHRTGYSNKPDDNFADVGPSLSTRKTACSYRGHDTPGVSVPPGSQVDMHLYFKGQSYDRCRRVFGPVHLWESVWDGPVP